MMRSLVRIFWGLSAVAVLAMAGTTALAGDLGIVVNGDMETISRFDPHGVPGVDHPNGYADGWHHSANSAWSNGTTDPTTSPTHSLYIPDDRDSDHDEMRSFATDLPRVGDLGRVFNLTWNWDWTITSAPGDMFSATVRISKSPVGGFDLGGAITDHLYLTDGSASSGGFQAFTASIPLAPDDASFDVIFRTRDNVGDSSETGVLFVDDVSSYIPEPATMGLLGLGSLGLMMVSRRRRS
jgi:hypothetical protein